MSYVDGYLVPVPKKNIASYRRIAQQAGKFGEHGALDYKCVATTSIWDESILGAVKRRDRDLSSVRHVIVRPVNAKVMKDPRITGMCDPKSMPFDCKRMAYGGFKVLVDA
jgi:uncharacterized protein YbaA (DUF1428 family)